MANAPPKAPPDAPPALILASKSAARATLLYNAGIHFDIDPATLDEAAIRRMVQAESGAATLAAATLAEAKAMAVSQRHEDALVIGADQILECDNVWFDKPGDMDQARADLLALRGLTHQQHSAVSVARGGALLWHHVETAHLTMRDFSDDFLDDHLAAAGTAVLASAGAYQLEGLGVGLFSRIEGDYFSILGLPLLPLLDFLRQQGVVGS